MDNGFKIIAPWIEYQKRIVALFAQDSEIKVSSVYEPEGREVDYAFDIEVRNHKKFEALNRVIPDIKEFGNVTLGIQIYDEENVESADDQAAIYKALFQDNSIVDDVRVVTDPFGVQQVYVMFKPEVVQYYRDEMMDYNGLWSGLAQDIAKEVFDTSSGTVHFCTTAIKPF